MLLDLSEIVMREGMRVTHDIDQPSVEDPDLVFAEPIRGRLVFDNSGELINIHGDVATALVLACSRCLTDVRVPVELKVEEHMPVEEVQNPTRPVGEDTDFDSLVSSVVYLEQGRPILDLDELLRQLIVTEIPLRAICQDACAGLCPQCGANRNEAPCACPEPEVNRPLAGLAALLKEDGGQEPGGNGG